MAAVAFSDVVRNLPRRLLRLQQSAYRRKVPNAANHLHVERLAKTGTEKINYFPFLALPYEVRVHIYREVLHDPNGVYIRNADTPQGHPRAPPKKRAKTGMLPAAACIQVSRVERGVRPVRHVGSAASWLAPPP
jgi:hypothetical protein